MAPVTAHICRHPWHSTAPSLSLSNFVLQCARLPPLRSYDHFSAIARAAVDELPPFPMANGPLFGVSSQLARFLLASGEPDRWQMAIENSPSANRHLAGIPCWPTGDAILGYWIAKAVAGAAAQMTLIDTPAHRQHHPYLVRKNLSNKTIVVHGFKNARNDVFRERVASEGARTFQPMVRECDSCARMAWVTWPRHTPAMHWRCCGHRLPPGQRRYQACRSAWRKKADRSCPRLPTHELIRLANTFE